MYLQALGIKGGALQQCISDVHIAAVKSLYSISQQREAGKA
jgi:hypothetical protein